MATNFMKFKKNPSELLSQMKDAAEKQTKKGGGQSDSRFWKPVFDKEKATGSAVIRFLPSVDDDELPWVRVYFRQFKGPTGRWYIENDLSTVGRDDDPVFDLSRRCYNSGIESDKKGSSFLKRKVKYIANVLVIKDPSNSDNNGKTFLYEFGQQIFDVLQNARQPKFEDQAPLEPFDPFHGANFNLRIVGKLVGTDTVPNYEQSFFGEAKAIAATDEAVVEICNRGISLKEFISADKFKEPEELKQKLFDVLGGEILSGIETVAGWGSAEPKESKPKSTPKDKPAPKSVASAPAPTPSNDSGDSEGLPWDDDVTAHLVPDATTPADSEEDVDAFMQNLLNS